MRGGVIVSDEYIGTTQEALYFFLANSTFRIISDESIASYIYTCHLKAGVTSPYIHMRSDNFKTPARCILLKVMFHTPYSDVGFVGEAIYRYGTDPAKEITYSGDLIEEVEIQQQIYQDSFKDELTPCEPICPSIITYLIGINSEDKKRLSKFIIDNLISRKIDPEVDSDETHSDEEITSEIFKQELSLIAMEMMEDYVTLSSLREEYWDRVQFKKLETMKIRLMLAWNLARLKNVLGIAHLDLHEGNVLFNPKKRFYGDFFGQMVIIDFGRIAVRNKIRKPMPTDLKTWRMAIYNSRFSGMLGSCKVGYNHSVHVEMIKFGKFNQQSVDMLNKMTELRKGMAIKFLTDFQTKYGMSFQMACSKVGKPSSGKTSGTRTSKKSSEKSSKKSSKQSSKQSSEKSSIRGLDFGTLSALQKELNVVVPRSPSLTPTSKTIKYSSIGSKSMTSSGTRKQKT